MGIEFHVLKTLLQVQAPESRQDMATLMQTLRKRIKRLFSIKSLKKGGNVYHANFN